MKIDRIKPEDALPPARLNADERPSREAPRWFPAMLVAVLAVYALLAWLIFG